MKEKKSGQGSDWSDKGIAFLALVIEHVVTWRYIKRANRNLHYVLQLILEGNVEAAERINKFLEEKAEEESAKLSGDDEPIIPRKVDPYDVLLRDMTKNEDTNRYLAMEAKKLEREAQKIPKYFAHVSGQAAEDLRWLRSESMERALQGWGDESRRFDPRKLKTHKISLFIVLPVDDLDLYEPWLQSLFVGIFAAMRESKIKPEFPVLTMLDEFSSLGYQDYIASSLDNIRGAGMKLCFIVQNYGKLKKLYGDEMESFLTNSGLELYFGKIGTTATEYVKKELGEAQVVMTARSVNRSENESEAVGKSIALGETMSQGGSEANTAGTSRAHTVGEGFSFSKSVNYQDSENFGQSEGTSMGTNYGPHVFWQGFQHSNNYGTQINKNQGRARSEGRGETKTKTRNESRTDTTNESRTLTSTWNTSTSRTETDTRTETKGYQIGGGIAESFHKKPLLDAHEINSFLRSIPDSECDHPAFPGLMLVRIAGEDPFFLRRSNYDQDPFFQGCFSKDPLHEFVPLHRQPLLGYQYTPAHVVTFGMPNLLRQNGFEAMAEIRAHQKFDAGERLFSYGIKNRRRTVEAPVAGRIVAVADAKAFQDEGAIITAKTLTPLDDNDRLIFKKSVFGKPVQAVKTAISKVEKAKAARAAEIARREAAEAAALAKRKAEAWAIYDRNHAETLGLSYRALRFLGKVGSNAVAGTLIGLGAAGMVFGESLIATGIVVGLLGGIGRGVKEFLDDENKITAQLHQQRWNIMEEHGPMRA